MIFGKNKKYDIKDRRTEEDFLQSFKNHQESKSEERSKPDTAQSIKLMLRGAVFFGMLLIIDIGYRKYRYTDSPMETVFFVLFLMSAVGTLQLPAGLYYLIKNMWQDIPTNKKGR
ncbi:MAG: hypothetical protein Q4A75_09895 [Peptostreptococcaceae bacterium]|nr:hypothetical protein [Peptostreptococcaceae bacterium]